MEIHKEELKIVDLFRKNLLSEFTLKQIMERINKRSYNWTYKAVDKLGKEILISKKKGNTTIVKLNIKSPYSITYLSYLDREEAYKREVPFIGEIIESCCKATPYFILIVTGSHATGNARNSSDIDLVVITEDEEKKKEIKPYIREITRLSNINFDVHILGRGEFYNMLIADNENFGKEVFRKHLIFYGSEAYYQIIKEATRKFHNLLNL
ncbi:nucleotidyltransferase domain-containing protein [Candidatus Woesearchaeota archaeon]|nr:nucleotidyltransferase domain-containing protein [Candidatus Woesearchaeota archaeon]